MIPLIHQRDQHPSLYKNRQQRQISQHVLYYRGEGRDRERQGGSEKEKISYIPSPWNQCRWHSCRLQSHRRPGKHRQSSLHWDPPSRYLQCVGIKYGYMITTVDQVEDTDLNARDLPLFLSGYCSLRSQHDRVGYCWVPSGRRSNPMVCVRLSKVTTIDNIYVIHRDRNTVTLFKTLPCLVSLDMRQVAYSVHELIFSRDVE